MPTACLWEEGPFTLGLEDIVPVLLLERYQTMTDPNLAQNLDSEIGRHCAHSLPAVALTLGRQYWPCLRTTYRCLVSDVQWKVRYIVASCLHELATILGPEIASRDLVPSFEGFIRDVDEVRAGLLERLAQFLRGLSRGDQRRSLPLLADFLCMDNSRNWRFRSTLARRAQFPRILGIARKDFCASSGWTTRFMRRTELSLAFPTCLTERKMTLCGTGKTLPVPTGNGAATTLTPVMLRNLNER
ncbi:hypothetical protein HPB51_016749 [Rhipicephalus microplus]|uniref:Serine/threonine-protein phosphatase 4 regulatory subunit 1 n=1 Tax=Rhipicephalus microplus TaxID=6941 RepID=A0A9J6DAN3_RHIMP|nr:hypothetical protein HPB51_016749 [Rhipicephalus microplus]